jgi:hypothetical protein
LFRIIFSTIVLLIFTAVTAQAAENVPGSSCAGYTANSWQWAGGPENTGVLNGMFCNGSTNLFTGIITFKSSGIVGIGTTSPGQTLDVLQNANTFTGILAENNDTTASGSTQAVVQVKSGTSELDVFASPPTNVFGASVELKANVTNFFIDNSAAAGVEIFRTGGFNERMRIDSSGRVGIGTTAPPSALHVVGDIQYTGLLKDLSDRRAKSDIRPLPGQLANLMQLEPVSFVMNSDPKHRTELGLIAQDVEPIYPELVDTGTDGIKSLSYVSLVAPMIEAMQEQQAEIKTLWAAIVICFGTILFLGFRLWRTGKIR